MKGILFKGKMVQAILAGKKTQTRRLVKYKRKSFLNMMYNPQPLPPPYKVGDIVYVRETYRIDDSVLPNRIMYAAGMIPPHYDHYRPWKSGLLMPEKHARIFLEIIGVKKERVKDISMEEARAEGFRDCADFWEYFFKIDKNKESNLMTEVWAYKFKIKAVKE